MMVIPETGWREADPSWPWPAEPVLGDDVPDRPVLESLAVVVGRHGGVVALEDEAHRLTFDALWREIGVLADALGGSSGVVGILLPAGAAYSVAVFACIAAGRPALLLDPSWPALRTAGILADAGAGLLIVAGWAGPVGDIPLLEVRLGPGSSGPSPALRLDRALGVDAPALILCTSGSTGLPKTLVHSQRSMMGKVWAHMNGMGARAGDLCLSLIPPAALAGLVAVLGCPVAGVGLRFLDLRREGIGGLIETLTRRPVTLVRGGPSALRLITALPDAAAILHQVRGVLLTGEPVMQADIAALRPVLPAGAVLFTSYGSTESGSIAWYPSVSDKRDAVRTPAGHLLRGTSAVILDDDGSPCPAGEPGELWLRGPYNALGEWRDGACRPGALVADPVDGSRRIHRTGDIAWRGADDVYVILGRKDRMLKINGQRIEPGEIEAALRGCEGVTDCAVVSPNGRMIVGFVVLRPGATAAPLRAALRARVPAAMLPARIVALDALPRLPGGKIDLVSLTGVAARDAAA